jgi:serine/threonine protein kinase
MIIMEYANKGNLKGCLTEVANNWKQKLFILYKIIVGLNNIHKEGLIHCNFHNGNILYNKYDDFTYRIFISDYLGSYQLAKSFLEKDHNILSFMIPEILRGKPYTQASDIYNFSMIMWEFISGISPFNSRKYDFQLALSICKGERPEIIENTPQCYIDLMEKCWDDDPTKRPTASEVLNIFEKWIFLPSNMEIKNINKELKNDIMEFINAPIGYNNQSHLQACNTSHLLNFSDEELNELLEGSPGLKFLELKQKREVAEQNLFKLEMIAENSQTELKIKQNELKIKQNELIEMQLAYQKIKSELADSQQQNYQLEQNYQDLRLNSAVQIREFVEKESDLQDQIICLQNEKQTLANNLTEQLKQNKLTSQQVQIQIIQLEQEKTDLQNKLAQTEADIQKFKSQQESLIEQKKQLENKLSQSQVNYQQVKEEKIFKDNILKALLNLSDKEKDEKAELKAKLENEITQLKQKLFNEEQIKVHLTQAIHIKEDKINKLEKELINLDQKRIKQLKDKEKELNEIKKELVNKLTSGENTKEIHKEKEAKQKELNELKQELLKTSASYDANRKKQVLNQVNKFLKAKGNFLTLREETIRNLQKQYEVINDRIVIGVIGEIVSETKKFQDILIECNEVGLFQMDKDHNSLMNIVQENEELEVSHKISDILKLNSFNLNHYKIFTVATNFCEETRAYLDSGMMVQDIKLLRKNLDELKSELKQQKKELIN